MGTYDKGFSFSFFGAACRLCNVQARDGEEREEGNCTLFVSMVIIGGAYGLFF